jgi:hypothetical protein
MYHDQNHEYFTMKRVLRCDTTHSVCNYSSVLYEMKVRVKDASTCVP